MRWWAAALACACVVCGVEHTRLSEAAWTLHEADLAVSTLRLLNGSRVTEKEAFWFVNFHRPSERTSIHDKPSLLYTVTTPRPFPCVACH